MSHLWIKFKLSLLRTLDLMDMRDWTIFLLVVIIIGMFCMRGYGSRKNY